MLLAWVEVAHFSARPLKPNPALYLCCRLIRHVEQRVLGTGQLPVDLVDCQLLLELVDFLHSLLQWGFVDGDL